MSEGHDFQSLNHPLRLAVGSHLAGSGRGCAMNVISWENGDSTITDFPGCSDSFLARLVQRVNDSICTHRDEDLLCSECSVKVLELGHRTVGTALDWPPDKRARLYADLAKWCADAAHADATAAAAAAARAARLATYAAAAAAYDAVAADVHADAAGVAAAYVAAAAADDAAHAAAIYVTYATYASAKLKFYNRVFDEFLSRTEVATIPVDTSRTEAAIQKMLARIP